MKNTKFTNLENFIRKEKEKTRSQWKKLGAGAGAGILLGTAIIGAGFGINSGINNNWGRRTPVINTEQSLVATTSGTTEPLNGESEVTDNLQNKLIALYIVKKAKALFEDVSVEYTEEIIKVSFKNPANEEAVSVSFTLDENDRIKLIANEEDHTFFNVEEENHKSFTDIVQEDETTLNTLTEYYLNQRPKSFSVNPTRSFLRNRVINVNDIQQGEDDSGFFWTDKSLIEATFGVYQDELFIDENEVVETPATKATKATKAIVPPVVETPQTPQTNTELGLGSVAIQQIYDHFKPRETEDQISLRRLDRTDEEGGDNVDAQSMMEIRFENSKKLFVISSPQEFVNLVIVVYIENSANIFLKNSVSTPATAQLAIDYIATEISIANGNLGDLEDKDVNARSSQEIDRISSASPDTRDITTQPRTRIDSPVVDQVQNDDPTHIDQIQEVFSEELQEGKIVGLGDVPTKPMVMEVHSVSTSSRQSSGISLGKRAVFQFETVGTGDDSKLIVSEVTFINKGSLWEITSTPWSKAGRKSPGRPNILSNINFQEIKTRWDAFIRTERTPQRAPLNENQNYVELNVPPVLEPKEEVLVIYTTPTVVQPQPAVKQPIPASPEMEIPGSSDGEGQAHIDQIQEVFSEEVLARKVSELNNDGSMEISSDSDLKLRFWFEEIDGEWMVEEVVSITLDKQNKEIESKIWSKDYSNPINFQEIKTQWDSLASPVAMPANILPPTEREETPLTPEQETQRRLDAITSSVAPDSDPIVTTPIVVEVDDDESLSEIADRLAEADRLEVTTSPNWDQFTLSEEIKSQFRRSSGWVVTETMIGEGNTNPKLRIEKNGYYFEIKLWQTRIEYKFMKSKSWWSWSDEEIDAETIQYVNADWLFNAINEQLTRAV